MDHQLYTPALRPKAKQPNFNDGASHAQARRPNVPQQHMARHLSLQDLRLKDRHQITFDNVIKPQLLKPLQEVNTGKLFSYDQQRLFGNSSEVLTPSAFSYIIDNTKTNCSKNSANPKQQRAEPLKPSLLSVQHQPKPRKPQILERNRQPNQSIFDPSTIVYPKATGKGKQDIHYSSLAEQSNAQLFQEQHNQHYLMKEESIEKLVSLVSDNYLGTLNCVLHCLLKTLPLKQLLRRYQRAQLQKNESSKYEGVVIEVISDFFSAYEQSSKRTTYSAVKVMSLLELINPKYKSFFKRDPFEMLTTLVEGLHDELNRAPNQSQFQPSTDNPAFDNKGIIEFDYIQAEKWNKFFKTSNDSSILDMFQGRILKHIQCLSCYNPKLIFENFMHLTLELKDYPREETIDITELIAQKFQNQHHVRDRQEGQTQFYCLKCRKKTPYKKEKSIWAFPNILVLHIQRFQNLVNRVNSYQHNVRFPIDCLDLRQFSSVSREKSVVNSVYSLYGVTSLAGTLNVNKYQAHVLNAREDRWYLYDENEKVSQSGIESPSKQVYLLFYQRIDALSKEYK